MLSLYFFYILFNVVFFVKFNKKSLFSKLSLPASCSKNSIINCNAFLKSCGFPAFAKKNLVRIPLSGQSVPHEQKGKFGGAAVFLMPASHGTGVIAGGAVRAVLESVGIHDVLSKSQGSSNPHNVVKATFDALLQMRSAATVAKQRGVSLEKVFKG